MSNNLEDNLKSIIDRIILDIKINGPKMTVTQRARSIDQPRGGYIKRVDFKEFSLGLGEEEFEENENVHSSLIAMAVDYLTRYTLTNDIKESFYYSLLGALKKNKQRTAKKLIKGLDDESIYNAIKITGFDVVYRNGGMGYVPVNDIKPNQSLINNTKIMVYRTLNFLEIYGPVIRLGFTFDGGYTKIMASGDGDYITHDTLWDLKVLKTHFNKKHIMQLLIYWRMGLRSDYKTFKNLKYIGIYNPRKNKVFRYKLDNIENGIINIIDDEIIGYTKPVLIS